MEEINATPQTTARHWAGLSNFLAKHMSTSPEPPLRIPLVDVRTGLLSREWAAFFRVVFSRTGGTSGVIPDIKEIKDAINDVQTELATQPDQAIALLALNAAIGDVQTELAMQPDQTVALLALRSAVGIIDIAVESLVVQTDAFDLAQAAQLGATTERLRALENLQVFA